MVSHCGLLYKLRSIGVEVQFMFIVSEFLSGIVRSVGLDCKAGASSDVVSGVP